MLSKQFDAKLLCIPVIDNKETFLFLPDVFQALGAEAKFIQAKENLLYLRKTVAFKLAKAAKCFEKKGMILQIESAYRNLSTQKEKFKKRFAEMKERYPKKTKPELLDLTNTYTAGIPILAAHLAGAAIDVTLLETKTLQPLDFGVPYRHGGVESATDFSRLPDQVKNNRKLLKEGMEKFGFINYPFEYWHFSLGDACWAYLTCKNQAIYGPIEYDPDKNKLSFPVAPKNYTNYFRV